MFLVRFFFFFWFCMFVCFSVVCFFFWFVCLFVFFHGTEKLFLFWLVGFFVFSFRSSTFCKKTYPMNQAKITTTTTITTTTSIWHSSERSPKLHRKAYYGMFLSGVNYNHMKFNLNLIILIKAQLTLFRLGGIRSPSTPAPPKLGEY